MTSMAGAGFNAAGGMVSAYGDWLAGRATQEADNYNAAVEQQRGTLAVQSADTQAQLVGQQTAQHLGTAQADYGAAGVQMSGSPLSVMMSVARNGELSRRLTAYKGQAQQIADNNQAALDRKMGKLAAQAGDLKAIAGLLTTAGGTANAASQAGYI